ncbi:type IV pilus secretin PilQ [Ferrimonas lipolytica]|uniref:Type IV pilus secretin PilQ family protein n=1 Tax=Ferrimonas lipolytica TaxID=2724191 RepID=A0A6H1UI55_9GAMM|nr:type IV pilus secretin PilQ family protein [Ferrimonas lipolytica]QIZ78508.1 type IV pilus secretin PilQ family protein [Ferrimonas lipolytica]
MQGHKWFCGQASTLTNKMLALGLLCGMQSTAWAGELTDLKYHSQVGTQVELEFTFSEPVAEPELLLAADPAQIKLNFSGHDSALAVNTVPVDANGVEKISISDTVDGVYANIWLDQITPYQTRVEGEKFYIVLNDTSEVASTDSKRVQVEAIDFHRSEGSAGELVLDLSSASTAVHLERSGADLLVTLYNADIPTDLLYVVNVEDFNTHVKGFETFQKGNNSQIRLDMGGSSFEYDYHQEGDKFYVVVSEPEQRVDPEKSYSGSKLSMNFQDIPVRTVLQIIADHNNFNLVTTDNVNGNLTLNLDDVPWDQALEMILRINGLDKRIEGNILLVAPRQELIAQETEKLRQQQESTEVAPLFSEYIQVNYAKATDLAALMSSDGGTLLSDRGTVSVDERTNTLLIQDTAERLEDIQRLVDVLDVPIKQVIIESRMVTIRDNIKEELGVRWGITDVADNGTRGTSGSLDGLDGLLPDGDEVSLDDRLNVNLPVADPAGTIAFQLAKLSDGTILDLELSALELENNGEVIASPRLTTANQFTASIEQGVEIPFVESSSSGATSVEFKKAVLSLTVTPQITPDNRIVLDLTVTQDTRGDTVQTGTGPATAIDTQRITTQVLAKNGETIVLGGIYQQQNQNVVTKVPILGDIPFMGWLFRTTSDFSEKSELLIFVTPKIVIDQF